MTPFGYYVLILERPRRRRKKNEKLILGWHGWGRNEWKNCDPRSGDYIYKRPGTWPNGTRVTQVNVYNVHLTHHRGHKFRAIFDLATAAAVVTSDEGRRRRRSLPHTAGEAGLGCSEGVGGRGPRGGGGVGCGGGDHRKGEFDAAALTRCAWSPVCQSIADVRRVPSRLVSSQ